MPIHSKPIKINEKRKFYWLLKVEEVVFFYYTAGMFQQKFLTFRELFRNKQTADYKEIIKVACSIIFTLRRADLIMQNHSLCSMVTAWNGRELNPVSADGH